ncbi:unnamed protein product [Medioppia subpectinata]|uniref:Protein kinase domain-containing protein n=1 Tax=Medioppia subpectinata TaxID=1979941 RepID=A0A7R9L430_9ACAR|nr:unnamed protein product [Medioppia subpectinata]CAG2114944.1 unnamed protein product [Medioppia subpectinata]
MIYQMLLEMALTAIPDGAVHRLTRLNCWPDIQWTGMNYWEIFDELVELGSGGFGHVFKVRDKYNDSNYAIWQKNRNKMF